MNPMFKVLLESRGQWITMTSSLDLMYAREFYDRTLLLRPDEKVKLVEERIVQKVLVDNYTPQQPC